jgi:hypothetical protein
MKKCAWCGKKLTNKRRKYCNATCQKRFSKEGPAREQFHYKEEEIVDAEAKTIEIDAIVAEGAWLCFTRDHEDDRCIGDFMRIFKRAPKHVLWSPTTPLVKYAGPVYTDEELARRWSPPQRSN